MARSTQGRSIEGSSFVGRHQELAAFATNGAAKERPRAFREWDRAYDRTYVHAMQPCFTSICTMSNITNGIALTFRSLLNSVMRSLSSTVNFARCWGRKHGENWLFNRMGSSTHIYCLSTVMVYRLVVDSSLTLWRCVSFHQTSHWLHGKADHLAEGSRQSYAEGWDGISITDVTLNGRFFSSYR